MIRTSPDKVGEYVAWAHTQGIRLVIALTGRDRVTNANRTFNLTQWKSEIDKYRDLALEPYIANGTIVGHYVIDEPWCAPCWGGQEIPSATVEELARYSKSIWPNMATGVRAPATLLAKMRYVYLDFAWAQWEGPLHVPSDKMTPEQFRDVQTAAARERGLGLVFGLNYLDGGDKSSGIPGTYENSTSEKVNRWQMSAEEVKRVGAVLVAAPLSCAHLSWQYDLEFLARPGMQSAIGHLAEIAKNHERTSCQQR